MLMIQILHSVTFHKVAKHQEDTMNDFSMRLGPGVLNNYCHG